MPPHAENSDGSVAVTRSPSSVSSVKARSDRKDPLKIIAVIGVFVLVSLQLALSMSMTTPQLPENMPDFAKAWTRMDMSGSQSDRSLKQSESEDPQQSLSERTLGTSDQSDKTANWIPPAPSNTTSPKPKKPMNILFLYGDDWRFDTMSMAGNPIVKTPVIDQLAREGVRFTHNCVTTAICWVSRATLLSGKYMTRHGTRMPGQFDSPYNETIFALLKQKGYHTGHVGKLGIWKDLDNDKHIDSSIEYEGWHYSEIGGKMWHITEKNEADALRFLSQRPTNKPFFLHVGFYATHAVDGDTRQYIPQNRSLYMYANDTVPVPITGTDESWKKMPEFFGDNNEGRTRWRWRYDTPEKHQHMMKNYYRMASEVDTACGMILELLKRQGEIDNTLIIFTTDNGNFHAEHGLADKWYPHQESIRVPLVIKDPRMPKEKAGSLNDALTLNIDLAPTILAAAGLEVLPSMMGRDMSVLYREEEGGAQLPAKSLIPFSSWFHEKTQRKMKERHHPHAPLSEVPWRTEFFYEHPVIVSRDYIPSSEALVRKDFKYFYWPDFDFEQMFDMKADPIEDNDLLGSPRAAERNLSDLLLRSPATLNKLNEMRKRFLELKGLVHSNTSVTL